MEALAYHFGRSDDRAKALRYLERAGDEAQQRFAHAAAAEYFRAALERRASEGRLSDVAPLREKLGTALLSAARYDEALTMFEQSLNDYRAAGDEDGVRRVTGLAAEAHFHRGTGHDLIGHISELAARSAPGGAGSESLGELVLRQGLLRLLFGSGAYRQMLVLGRALARIGRTTRNAGLLAAGERAQGAALIYLGRLAEGAAMLDAALRDSPTAGRHAHATEIGPILGAAYLVMGALDRGRELSRQILHLAQAQNNPILVATHTVFLGTAHYLAGNWASGRAFLQRSDELFAAVGPTSLAVRTIGVRVIPLIWEGEWVEARRRLETSLERARAMRLGPAERQASAYLAELDVREGRPQSAVARLAPLQHSELTWVDAVPVLSALAWAYLELGDLEQAQALAQRSVAETERTGARFFGITARRVRGMIEARQGDTDRARATFAEGLRLARSMPCPYEEARLLEALGQLERQQNNLAVANENLEQGRAIFERLGARMDLQFHRRDGEGARG